ncbi:hypothetical protein FOA52_015618 [Chlamydomonas sp. UWO 241]|nr:hypothetical protein FOA52_015618 [Chlamydomonas sp. UWO 241]
MDVEAAAPARRASSRSNSLKPPPSSHGTDDSVTIEFKDLGFVMKHAVTGEDKTILRGISGRCEPGRLFALMGSSGAGKTTLLDILACQVPAGAKMAGEVLINGQTRDTRAFLKKSCYVTQRDHLFASATVRECVTTSALLKLPMSMTHAEKQKQVDDVLAELELDSCADVLIGDEVAGIKGVSGGQKRRVSLAIELVKDPIVIFADEPTSGLDSEVALSIIDALLMLARKRRTVVCTIHQPNSDITDMFDDLMLLAKGRCVYAGPWKKSVEWFDARGFKTPTYKNPSDFFMSIIKDDAISERLADARDAEVAAARSSIVEGDGQMHRVSGESEGSGRATWTDVGVDSGKGPHVALQLEGGGKGEGAGCKSLACASVSSVASHMEAGLSKMFRPARQSGSRAPMWYQAQILITRTLRDWYRNPNMLLAEFVQYVFIAIFIGLIYVQFDATDDGVYDRAACIWLSLAIMSFTPSYTALVSWNSTRSLLRKELNQKQYSVTALYISRALVLLPIEAIQVAAFVSIMYFFVGFQVDASKFFLYYAVILMFMLICEGLGLLAGIFTKQPTFGIVILTFVLLILLSFSGFLTSSIPVYFIWINKISFLTYSYNALLKSQLMGLFVEDSTNPGGLVDALTLLPPVVDNGLSVSTNVWVLTGIWVGVEGVKLCAMHLANYWDLI